MAAQPRFSAPAALAESPHCSTTLVRKSRFLARSCRAASVKEARGFVDAIRRSTPDATHNCWAYLAGPPGDTAFIGSSDDGEPHGTAGRPMLNALLHCGIGQICVVVSRWFGGIKLGTGGLARAYQDAVLNNLESLPLLNVAQSAKWLLRVDYAFLAPIRRLLPACEATIEKEEYGKTVEMVIAAPLDRGEDLKMAIASATNGQATLEMAADIA